MGLYWGLFRKFYTVFLLFLQFSVFQISSVQAAPSDSTSVRNNGSNSVNSKTLSAKDKTSEQGVSSAQNTNKSVAQGLSLAESMMLSGDVWGFQFYTNANRGVGQYGDTWTSTNYLSLSYALDRKDSLGISIGNDTLLYKYNGTAGSNRDSDPQQYGLQDISLSYTRTPIWSDKYNRLVWSSAITFPASRASQRNSLVVDISTGFTLRYQALTKLLISPSVSVYGRDYQYDTANVTGIAGSDNSSGVSGVSANSPFGFKYGLGASYTFNQYFIGSLSYSQTQRYDYFHDWRTIQRGTAAMTMNATDVLNVSVGYNWKDRTITNEPLFSANKSIYFIGVGYVF